MNWHSFPKTELHIHLEGAAPVDFIRKLSAKKNIDLSRVFDGDTYRWHNFNDFLATYEAVMSVLNTPEDFGALTKAVLSSQADHGVRYTELTLGVYLIAQNDPVRWMETLAAIDQSADECTTSLGIEARYTAVIVRHFGADKALETAKLITKYRSPRVTGFGMAGAEDFGRPRDFKEAFQIAREAKFGLTVHAGEWGAPELIEESILTLEVTRLGHGVRAVESTNTMAMIKDRDIHLEVNPGSNIALGVAKSWKDHQIHQIHKAGLSYSISTDDPPYFHTSMTNEYTKLAQLGWHEAEFHHMNREALRHAFVDEDTRQKLLKLF